MSDIESGNIDAVRTVNWSNSCTCSLTKPPIAGMARISVSLGANRNTIHPDLVLQPEGPWSEVSKAIHDCHAAVHAKGAPRVATDIRIGTRVDREIQPGTGNESKVKREGQKMVNMIKSYSDVYRMGAPATAYRSWSAMFCLSNIHVATSVVVVNKRNDNGLFVGW